MDLNPTRQRHDIGVDAQISPPAQSDVIGRPQEEANVKTPQTSTRAVLEGMYAAEAEYLAAGGPLGTASFEILVPFFAPDVVLHQDEALPYGGRWRGHDGMERFFVAMSETWDVFDMVEQEFMATGRTAVVLTQVHARARATGTELDFPILQTVQAVDGRITQVRPFYWNTPAIVDACKEPGSS